MFKSREFIREIEPAFETLGETQTEIPMVLEEQEGDGHDSSVEQRVQDRFIQAKGDGMEEQKEDLCLLDDGNNNDTALLSSPPRQNSLEPQMPSNVTDQHGFRAQLESFLTGMFCGDWVLFSNGHARAQHTPAGATGAAAGPLPSRYYHHPPYGPFGGAGGGVAANPLHPPPNAHLYQLHPHGTVPEPAPLSIAEELQRLALQNPPLPPPMRRGVDIPRFLGEHGEHDDDAISAISAHTLEEMVRQQQAALQAAAEADAEAKSTSQDDTSGREDEKIPGGVGRADWNDRKDTTPATIDEATSFHGPETTPADTSVDETKHIYNPPLREPSIVVSDHEAQVKEEEKKDDDDDKHSTSQPLQTVPPSSVRSID